MAIDAVTLGPQQAQAALLRALTIGRHRPLVFMGPYGSRRIGMKFIVTDREGIEAGIVVRSAYVVISIHDPGKCPAKVRKQGGLRDVLVLAFHDAEPGEGTLPPPGIRLMTADQAQEIRRFVERHKDDVGAVVVHCEQGVSRSPAVAAALCKLMGGDDGRFWREYQPNPHVYRLVLEASCWTK